MSDFDPAYAIPLLPQDDFALALKDMSDRGNSERFAVRFGADFLFVRGHGWHVYTGTHWARDGADERVLLAAARVAELMAGEAETLFAAATLAQADDVKAKNLQKRAVALKEWAQASGNLNRCNGMLAFARAKLTRPLEVFDADPMALNCANGTLRFVKRKGAVKSAPDDERYEARLDPHDPKDWITRLAPFAWKPEASAPIWTAHLERCIPDGRERRFLARIFGYCALGLQREQAFFLFQGRGGDGKSVTVNAVRRVLGGYAANADVKTFLEDKSGRSGAAASPDLARLAGACRLVSTSEPPRGARLNEALVKLITGGAPTVARHLNKDAFEFSPKFRLLIECNARPAIAGGDDGIWRRVVLMLWRVQLKKADMDPQIEDKIVAQGEAVLAWIVRGALAYLDMGLAAPESIDAAHADYKRGSNLFREWLDLATEPDPEGVELISRLFESYSEFMAGEGADERSMLNAKSFGLALSDHQIVLWKRTSKGRKGQRKGARLLSPDEVDARLAGASAILPHASDMTPNQGCQIPAMVSASAGGV